MQDSAVTLDLSQNKININELKEIQHDDVKNPSHYAGKGIDVIDVIEAFDLDFPIGNAAKYILRAGKKGKGKKLHIQDLRKAIWYIERKIKNLEK